MDIPPEIKALTPAAVGVVAGHMMRWSAAASRGRKWVRMALLDLPAMIGLTLLSGAVASYLHVEPLIAAGIGTGVGYLGCEIVNILLARFFPEKEPS